MPSEAQLLLFMYNKMYSAKFPRAKGDSRHNFHDTCILLATCKCAFVYLYTLSKVQQYSEKEDQLVQLKERGV